MSARSFIGTLRPGGSVEYLYCHWTGYPSNLGPILARQYDTQEKIDELIAGGDMSVLGSVPGVQVDFDEFRRNSQEDQCLYYHRDRGEPWSSIHPKFVPDHGKFLEALRSEWTDFAYLWDGREWQAAADLAGAFGIVWRISEKTEEMLEGWAQLEDILEKAEQEPAASR